VIDVTEATYAIELTGTGEKLDAFVEAIRGIGIIEVARSGTSGIARGEKGLRV
jgi:acetolactate synthase-1/3 small subunit